MKSITIIVFLMLSINSYSDTVSKNKVMGPECTGHLMKKLKLNSEDAYQICSQHNEETKLCLIENSKLSKKELMKKCHKLK